MNELIFVLFVMASHPQQPATPPPDWSRELWAMTASHHQWPAPPEKKTPSAIAPEQAPPADHRTPEQKASDDKLLDEYGARLAKYGTGRMVWDPVARLYVPEMKSEAR